MCWAARPWRSSWSSWPSAPRCTRSEQHASIATLITVNTLAAIVGGAVPVPGGLGVVEAGLIAGLTSAGIPQDQAVAAVLIQRFCTAYLPPVWGFLTLTWMRRREYV